MPWLISFSLDSKRHCMTDQELIGHVLGALRRLEGGRSEGDPMRAVTADSLLRRRIEGGTIHFESDTSHAHIEVGVDRESGEIGPVTYYLPPP